MKNSDKTDKSNLFSFSNTKHIRKDTLTNVFLWLPTAISASFVIIIIFFITLRGIKPFLPTFYGDMAVDFWRFISGTTWYRPPNVYGIFFVVINTIYVVFLATLLAAPISVLTALFIGRMTNRTVGGVLQTGIELLAAIPSIVYGVFGLGMVNRFVMSIADVFGKQTAGGISTLSSVFVLGMMIIPTITMMSLSAINAVDREMENNSLALGASKIQTYFRITLKASASGIVSGIVLGVGRALGEATAVSMVAGNAGSGPTFDLFNTTRTMTSTILLGLKETTGLDYDIRFSVGVILIVLILVSNAVLAFFKKKAGKFI